MQTPHPEQHKIKGPQHLRHPFHLAKAFTMVEVVIAIGVLSFSVIPMMAMIAGSLKTYHEAINDVVGRQIMTELAANAQQARLADLQSNPTQTAYFDFEGTPVIETDPLRIYTATVTSAPGNELPNSLLNSPNLWRVTIVVQALDANNSQQTSLQILPQN